MLVTFDESVPGMVNGADPREILALDSALDSLNRVSARQAKLVEWRFFAGLEVGELATLLEVSEATVTREWRTARAWLAREIRRSSSADTNTAGFTAH
jgi:DNA-directed RNA polymerase specialized sigma24 family protein